MRDRIACLLLTSLALAAPGVVRAGGPMDYTFTVNVGTNLGDADGNDDQCLDMNNQCSLRAAIEQINFHTDGPQTLHRINVDVATVTLNGGGLPSINFPTVVDGGDGNVRARINGNSTSCFSLNSPESGGAVPGFLGFPNFNNSRLENLVINNCSGNGVSISGHGYVVSNSYIGTDNTGESAVANTGDGIDVTSPAGENSIPPGLINALLPDDFSDIASIITYILATVPGIAPNAIVDNVISGNQGDGIDISGEFTTATIVFNNRIGTDKDGTTKISNGTGAADQYAIRIGGSAYANIIGLNNIIAGMDADPVDGGVMINTGPVPFPNIVAGNFVGTAGPLFPDLGNNNFGIRTSGVRPTSALDAMNNPNTIENPLGVSVVIGPGNIVGYNGSPSSINFNDPNADHAGISINNGNDEGVIVTGNIVGISDGIINAIDIGNNGDGINVSGTNHIIGGDTLIQGNIVGQNERHGIVLRGGTSAGGNVTRANAIGTLPDFLVDAPLLGNAGHGIFLVAGGQEIGGDSFDNHRNVIANNGLDGIDFFDQTSQYGNHISKNSIYGLAPGRLGIDLKATGGENLPDPTDNSGIIDREDFSEAYTNWQQNTVTLSNPGSSGGNTTASYELRSELNGQYTIQFFASDVAERGGREFLCELTGVSPVTPDGDGGGVITGSMCAGGNLAGRFVTATVTDTRPTDADEPDRPGFAGMSVPILNTSEFSAPLGIPDEVRFTAAVQPDALESAGTVQVTVERVGGGNGAVTADVVVTGGTATPGAGNDYVLGTAQVTWANGQTGTRTVDVTINNDSLDELDETVLFDLQNVTGAIEGTPNTTSLTILDNDPAPTISVADNGVNETEATVPLVFTATLSAATSFDVLVTYSTTDASATSPADYTDAVALQVNIPAGSMQAMLPVDVAGDLLDEDNETFVLDITATNVSAMGNDLQAIGTIVDNDPLPVISINDVGPTNEGDGPMPTPFVFTVSIDAVSGRPVTARVTSGNVADTASAPSDYAVVNQLVTIPAGSLSAPVTVNVVGDTTFEAGASETFTLTLAADAVQPLNAMLGDAVGLGTIINDDAAPPPPELQVSKTHSGDFAQGQVGATYTITVTNIGDFPTDGSTVSVVDTLPSGLTATALTGTGWNCVLGTLTCTRSDVLSPSSSYEAITLTVNVAGNATSPQVNMAMVSGGGDTSPGDNTATDPTVITGAPAAPDLSLAKTHAGSFTQGQTGAMYTLTVSNSAAAPTDGTMVSVVDTLPAGLTATGLSGSGWNCVLGTLTCTRSDVLAVSSSYPDITLTVDVAGNAPSQVINQATLNGGGDASPGNNTAMDPTEVIAAPPAPELSIGKSHVGDFAQGQVGATYTLAVSVSQLAPTDGSTVTVTDTLPAGLTATGIAGMGWNCVLGTLTCTRSDVLSPGTSYPAITLTVNVAANATSPQINMASVSGGGDVSPGDNTATDPTVITGAPAAADLSIVKSHAGNFTQGQVGAQYTLTVSNSASAATDGSTVTVIDTLPAGLTATAITGPGWNCVLGTLTCTRSDVLAVSSSYPAITLTVNVAGNATSPQVNIASVSGGGDASPGNNGAMDSTTITGAPAAPDLALAKSHAGNFTQGQVGAQYTLTVSNSAAAATDGTLVSVVDTLPAGLTATAIAGPGWNCVLGTLTCTRMDVLAVSSSYPAITLTVNVAGNATSPQVNMASVSGGGDTTPGNNAAVDSTTIVVSPAGTLQFTPANPDQSVAENVGTATFTVSRTGGSNGAVSTTIGLGGSALIGVGNDYTTGSTTLTWADGDAANKTLVVTVNDDAAPEAAETVTMTLGAPTGGATLGAPTQATLTIQANDAAAGTIGFAAGTVDQVVNEAAGTATFTFSRTGGSNGAVGLTVTLGGSAASPADYAFSPTTITWPDNDTADKQLVFTVVDDPAVEGTETVTLTLGSPTGGATLGTPGSGTLTILDNDGQVGQAQAVIVPAASRWTLVLLALLVCLVVARSLPAGGRD